MSPVASSFLIIFILLALIPPAVIAGAVFLSRGIGPRRRWLLTAAVIAALISYSMLAAVFTLPSDTMLQNALFFGSLFVIPALGIGVLLAAAALSR